MELSELDKEITRLKLRLREYQALRSIPLKNRHMQTPDGLIDEMISITKTKLVLLGAENG